VVGRIQIAAAHYKDRLRCPQLTGFPQIVQ